MEKIMDFDVIIVGGGPAGLSVGSELAAKGSKVAVIEKGIIGNTNRAWIVPGSIIAKLDDDTKKFAYNGVTRFLEHTSGLSIKWDAVAPWSSEEKWKCYPYIRQKEILDFWAGKIEKNGSKVFEKMFFIDFKIDKNGVSARCVSSNGADESIILKGKMMLDASGYSSQIIKQNRINRKKYFWWSVYGYELEFDSVNSLSHPGNLGEMKIGDYMLWQSFDDIPMKTDKTLSELRPIMEYEALDEKTVFVFILYYCDEIIDKDFMKSQFDYIIKNEESIKSFRGGNAVKERFGWYPSAGINQKNAGYRIAYIGDAGCWTIPAGWGMSFILQNYRIYAENIGKNIKDGDFSAKSLNKAVTFNAKEKYEILMDKLVLHFLSYAKPHLIDKFTKTVFDAFGGERLEIMFCLQMNRKESLETMMVVLKKFSLKELFGIFHNLGDYLLVIQVMAGFAFSWMVDLIRSFFGLKPQGAGFKYGSERRKAK